MNGDILPIEVKSGKDYKKHAALSNVMANEAYKIPFAYVFHNGNVEQADRVKYMPIYMLMFLVQKKKMEEMLYTIDLGALR